MAKVDFKKTLKHLYNPPRKFVVLEVPPMQFLMLDGRGDPNTAPEYVQGLEALYALSYTIKFFSKKELDQDYTVPPLEGLWWAEDMEAYVTGEKSEWLWTMLMMVPDWIGREHYEKCLAEVKAKKNPAALDKVRLETFHEGLSVQIMHIGPYSEEGPVLARLHQEFLPANNYVPNGYHHEIYLGDPRRTAPEKLRTVLRQPIRPAG